MLLSRTHFLPCRIIALSVLLIAPALCHAQLAQHVPGDALMYLEWRGVDNLGPGFERSHLKAVLDKSEFPRLLHQAIPAWMQRIADENAQIGPIEQMAAAIGTPLWTHPSAFYVGVLDLSNKDHPVPHVALLCDAGADAAAMNSAATNLAQMAGASGPVQVYVQTIGSVVAISTFPYPQTIDKPLSDADNYKKAIAQCGSDRVTTAYVDVQGFVQQIDAVVVMANDPTATAIWPKVRDAIGLNGIHRFAMSDGFSGRDWVSDVFVDAPAPRTGLASLLDSAPLSDDDLKLVPASATIAAVARFDVGKLVRILREAIAGVDPNTGSQMAAGLRQVNDVLGFDVQQDFLEALGDQWTVYIDPENTGAGALGAALINKPKDADKFAASMAKLQILSNSAIHAQLQQNSMGFLSFEFRQQTISGVLVNYAALPYFTPAWAMKDGLLYGGMYPQIVVAAATHNVADKSILDNPAYQDLRKRLGETAAINGMSFVDVPRTAPYGYQGLLGIVRLILGAGDILGLQSPAMAVPPLKDLMPELEADGGITWVDDAGLHGRSLSAFPGDELLVGDSASASSLIQLLSTFMPMLAQHANAF